MSLTKQILTFGLTDEQNTIINNSRPSKDCEVFATDAPTDLIALNAIALIINGTALSTEDRDMLFEYYREVNNCTDETVVWLENRPISQDIKHCFKCYESFETIGESLRYLLLSSLSRSRKAAEYSKKLTESLLILSLIRKKPGISTKKLSEETDISIRSVQRYITALQATGEWIEYDRSIHGWKLTDGISILFGDI